MAKRSARKRRRGPAPEKPVAIEPCGGDGCTELGLHRGPMVGDFQVWLCSHHFRLWELDETRRAGQAATKAFVDSIPKAVPVSKIDKGTPSGKGPDRG